MAVYAFFVWLLISCLLPCSNGQILPDFTAFRRVEDCTDGSTATFAQYFNAVTLDCSNCGENSTIQQRSANGLTCECRPGYRYVTNFGGGRVSCQACGTNEAVSEDGWECVQCPASSLNANTRTCDSCSGSEDINVLRLLNGNFANAVGTVGTVTCQTCSAQTQPNSQADRCERCHYTLSTGTATSCACSTSNQVKLKGICFAQGSLPASSSSTYLINLENSAAVTSNYLQANLDADFVMCNDYRNTTSCQSLANMCVLTQYEAGAGRVCALLNSIPNTAEFAGVKPQIYAGDDAEDVLTSTEIDRQWTVDPETTIPFLVGSFSPEGQFKGYQNMDGGFLQLCEAGEEILNAAFVFGTYYSRSCSVSALLLWDTVKYPLEFYEIYLPYTISSVENIFRIPVKISNYRDDRGNTVNQGSVVRDWQLTRRFFLVDNIATKSTATEVTPHVRYPSKIALLIELRDDANGQIFVPRFDITYNDISREQAEAGERVQISFEVSYSMDQRAYMRNFQIATGTLCSLAVVYAGYRSYVWNKRAGRLTIDFPTLVNLIFYLCDYLGNSFFIIVFGIAFYFFIFFKRQNVVFLVPPDGQAYEEWLALFASGFALKTLSLIHMIIMQCSCDIFMVDWERPKGQAPQGGDSKPKASSTVSIWRTYFVANEWNEIQTKRKINRVFQIFAVIFFLNVIGFEDTATKDPDGTVGKSADTYMSSHSPVFRMALASTVYLLVDVVQVIFFVFIYERFITDDIREFVDLCSMSNVSVFVMANAEFGYYIHGRSVHGRSDVDMREMCDMIRREEEDLVGKRGLVPQTEPQTFIMALPRRLRQRYETVYMPVQLSNATPASRAEQGTPGGKDKCIEAYGTLNRFLCAFIDHSLRDVDYVVKDKTFLEKILDTEFLMLTDKGIFYNDNGHSFDNILFYGNELTLIIFDVLFFCIVDLIFENFVLAGIITYLATELICTCREMGGKKNLAKKTLVDERFLI